MTQTRRRDLMEVRLAADTLIEYDSPGGQRIGVTLPAGTILQLPIGWIYNGVPSSHISVRAHD